MAKPKREVLPVPLFEQHLYKAWAMRTYKNKIDASVEADIEVTLTPL
jgi:hypothetical protein